MDAENTMIDIEKLSPHNVCLSNASVSIPFIAFEAALDREERKAKRQVKRLYYNNVGLITRHLPDE